MKFTILREDLLFGLQKIIGTIGKASLVQILSNVYIKAEDGKVFLRAGDLEIEMCTSVDADIEVEGSITIQARKFLNITKALPAESVIKFEANIEKLRVLVKSGRSRFTLSGLDANDYPSVDINSDATSISIPSNVLKRLIDKTISSSAQQDVRYYLNGLMFHFIKNELIVVGTDGHRLACSKSEIKYEGKEKQIIIPRKGAIEISRLLDDVDTPVTFRVSGNHVYINNEIASLTSKLIDGRYPDYKRVIPQGSDNILTVNRASVRSSVQSVAILSNEKFKGIRLTIDDNLIMFDSSNADNEDSSVECACGYDGDKIELGFNSVYLLDAFNLSDDDEVVFELTDSKGSALIKFPNQPETCVVIMSMRL